MGQQVIKISSEQSANILKEYQANANFDLGYGQESGVPEIDLIEALRSIGNALNIQFVLDGAEL
jgi:hypothetical protein